MAYREVTMVEIKEVLRLWRAGAKKKRIAAQLTLDVKTVRRYIAAAEGSGLAPGPETLSDEQVAAVVAALSPETGRPHGDGWERCEAERATIKKLLEDRVRLSKVRRLLHRKGVDVPYSTLPRFAVAELGFGQRGPTIPVADGKPGEEIHIDTGWMQLLEPDEHGKRRRFRAWIFTPHVSRYKFVYPCFAESTETAIEACEAAWEFYGGVFGVVVPTAHARSCTPRIHASRASLTASSSTRSHAVSTSTRRGRVTETPKGAGFARDHSAVGVARLHLTVLTHGLIRLTPSAATGCFVASAAAQLELVVGARRVARDRTVTTARDKLVRSARNGDAGLRLTGERTIEVAERKRRIRARAVLTRRGIRLRTRGRSAPPRDTCTIGTSIDVRSS